MTEGKQTHARPRASRASVRLVLRRGGVAAAALTGAGAMLSSACSAAQAPTVTGPSSGPTESTPAPAPVTTTPSSTDTATTPTTTATSPSTTTSTPTQTTTAPAVTPSKPPSARSHKGPKAVVQHSQGTTTTPTSTTPTTPAPAPASKAPATPTTSSSAIAPAPQLAAVQSGALASIVSESSASLQALDFYRIPLFLLPIYQAAAVQYGVPWQVLAAINEVETDFGTDLSVSTAGAVGWMQFMPETWLQYGVDALGAGYADPYNPVDAIFAAARYLHAAGASSNLRGAILAYNHSEAYAESVLLRARLFASYPSSTIATLTGLTEGSLPVAGAKLAPGSPIPSAQPPTPSTPASPQTAGSQAAAAQALAPTTSAQALAPATAAQTVSSPEAPAPASQLSELLGKPHAPVVAVEDGRIVGIGVSRRIGGYVVLRDTYGDVFTYGGLGSVAPAYRLAKSAPLQVPKGALPSGETGVDPTPTQAASAGSQSPTTLHVAVRKPSSDATAQPAPAEAGGKIRVFAHPGNPDAVAAKRLHEQEARARTLAAGWQLLRRGAIVSQGTVLGHLGAAGQEGASARLRFAIRPAGAQGAIDPRPVLENWRQLSLALHPRGSRAGAVLAGATAADAFQLTRGELERAVLSDPGIQLGACDRSQVAAGKVQPHLLALLVFLSRSGLKPTVGELRCGSTVTTASGSQTVFPAPGTLDIAAINGVPIAGHQGAGTVTDVTIRTLLTVRKSFAPKRIVSLMTYPGAPSTLAAGDHADYIQLELPTATSSPRVASAAVAAHTAAASSGAGKATHPGKISLNTVEWQRLVDQIATIQQPTVAVQPSASAIRDAPAPGSGGSASGSGGSTRTLP